MTTIGAAIIGPGKVAHIHARALESAPGARLVAVWGRNGERTTAFAEQYGARPYGDMDKMLAAPEVEMVILCTPHPLHADQAVRAAAAAGVHVLVEKPMAISLADCDRMIEAARANRVKLGVISQRRFYEPVQRVRQAIEAGKIGEPALGTITVLGWRGPEYYAMDEWRGSWEAEGGGVLVNQATHQLDIFQWLMGPIEELFGYWANLNHPYIEVEDTAVAVVRFRNGALGNIVVSNSQNPGLYGRIHVHGQNGATVGVQTDGGSTWVAGVSSEVDAAINDLWTVPGEEEFLARWQAEDRDRAASVDIMSYYHQLQLEDFIDAIIDDREPAVSGEEGRRTVELFTAIYRSEQERQPIRFPLEGS